MARHRLFDTFETSQSAQTATKKKWLQALKKNQQLPERSQSPFTYYSCPHLFRMDVGFSYPKEKNA